MKQLAALLLLCSFLLSAADAPNILQNGQLKGDTASMPDCWALDSAYATYYREGGPNDLPYVMFSVPENAQAGEEKLKQTGLQLIAGEKYRLSCMIKTKNFSAKRVDFIVIDYGWFHGFGFKSLPANTDWRELSMDITLGANKNNTEQGGEKETIKGPFTVIFYSNGLKGDVAIANISLVPLTEKAREQSKTTAQMLKKSIKPAPLAPRLEALPIGTKSLPIYWMSDNKPTVKATIDGKPATISSKSASIYSLDISNVTSGPHKVDVTVTEADGFTVSKSFTIAFAEPELPCPDERRLNPMTTELFAKNLNGETSVAFTVPRRTWVYFRFDGNGKPMAKLSGDKFPLFAQDIPRPEAQRRLNPGKYTLTFDAPATGRLAIRTVPIIYKYSGIDFTRVPEAGGYGMDFHKKHVFGVFNTMGARGVREPDRPYTASLGVECVDSCGTPSRKPLNQQSIDWFIDWLNKPEGPFNNPSSQWCEFDEYFWEADEGLLVAAIGLESLKNPYKKDLHHWFGGAAGPYLNGIQPYVMSNFMNVSGGCGYIAYEVYFRPKKTEADALNAISTTLLGSTKRMNVVIPNATPAYGYIFGNYHHQPIISLDWYTFVNFKYFLDMQFHFLANHDEFTGIPMVGYWGFSSVGDEVGRWCCELIRHYVLEGKKDRLSDKYGFTYILNHLQNGDFDDKLANWTCDGDVAPGYFARFGALNELRYSSNRIGDNFAVLTGNAAKRPTIRQTIKGLVPGKPYTLEYLTADADDTKAARVDPRLFDIEASFANAKIVHQFVHIDKRPKGTYNAITSKTNYRYYRFVPNATTCELTLTGSAKDGEKLLVNFVKVTPFFEEQLTSQK